jgi:hypothetical protein
MLTTIRYILITAIRDRLFVSLFGGIILAVLICILLGQTAFLESAQMTLSLSAGAARLILMIGLMVFACFHIRQAFDSKEIDVMLSRPVSRQGLLLSYWLGFSLVAFLLTIPVLLLMACLGVQDWLGYGAFAASLVLEAMLVVALSLFASFALRSAVSAFMGCLGFYVLSRMMAFFVMTSESGLASAGQQWSLLKNLLQGISMLVPRLDMFSKSEWLVYGGDTLAGWQWVPLQAVIFIPLLLLAAIIDFRRKEF